MCLDNCCKLDHNRNQHLYRQPIEFDPDFKGPLIKRSCTDVICLGIFIVFISCWVGIGLYAFTNGDPEMLLIPRDSSGSRCGYDPHVKDKPNLVFFDLTTCLDPMAPFTGCNTPQVCVNSCPTTTFLFDALSTSTSDFSKMICVEGVSTRGKSYNEIAKLVKEKKCAQWYLPSKSVLKRCLYNTADRRALIGNRWQGIDEVDLVQRFLYSHDSWLEIIAHGVLNVFTQNGKYHKILHEILDDIKNSVAEIVGGLAVAILVCIIYIAMMRWMAAIMVWLSIVGSIALLGFCVYYTAICYVYYRDHPEEEENASDSLDRFIKKQSTWLGLLIAVSVFLAIMLLILIFLRKRVVLAIGLIKEGSKTVSAATSTLFFPVIPWILEMGVLVAAVGVGLYLASIGDPVYKVDKFDPSICQCTGDASKYENKMVCNVDLFSKLCGSISRRPCEATCRFVGMNNPKILPYLQVYNVFGFFWGIFFFSAFGEMVLAATFATWYWTFHKKNVPFFTLSHAIIRTLRYHIGTLAFGSLIVAICRMIRVVLEYIDRKLKKYENPLTNAIMCCCKCFFWCLEKFLKFMNKNAYIMCAIHGKNFCLSAKDAFGLLTRNCIRLFVLDKVTDFLFFLSKLMVTIGMGALIYSTIIYLTKPKLHYEFVPVVLVGLGTFLIASVFFSVYTMAVDTLFLCFLEDSERNDGSKERPYFMSKDLKRILHKTE